MEIIIFLCICVLVLYVHTVGDVYLCVFDAGLRLFKRLTLLNSLTESSNQERCGFHCVSCLFLNQCIVKTDNS